MLVFKNLSIIEDILVDVYDGIMLPPDEDTKNFLEIWKYKVLKTFNKIVGRYYNPDMLKIYEDETIQIMFYEIIENTAIKFKNINTTKKYLFNVLFGIRHFYRAYYYNYSDESQLNKVKLINFNCIKILIILFYFIYEENL